MFDTCIWVGLHAGQIPPQQVVQVAGDALVYTSVVSLGELRYGVEVCADPVLRGRRAAALRQIEQQPVLDVSRDTAAAFGILAAAVKQAGRSPRPRYNDLWIAAQAIEHGHALLTLNEADFAGLPGLHVLSLAPSA